MSELPASTRVLSEEDKRELVRFIIAMSGPIYRDTFQARVVSGCLEKNFQKTFSGCLEKAFGLCPTPSVDASLQASEATCSSMEKVFTAINDAADNPKKKLYTPLGIRVWKVGVILMDCVDKTRPPVKLFYYVSYRSRKLTKKTKRYTDLSVILKIYSTLIGREVKEEEVI
jgi:hypothetical protein